MPLDTRLQDVNRILDPGIKTFAPDSSAFLPAYQHAQNRTDRLEQGKMDRAERLEQRNYERGIVSQATGQSPNEMFSQFTQLPTEKMYEKIGEMAPMAATPAGSRIIGVLSGIADRKAQVEQQSLSKQTALAIMKKQAEFSAEAINAGVDIANPEEFSAFRLRRSTAETMKAFTDLGIKLGKDVSKVEIPPDQIDQFGNWKDPATPLNLLRNAPSIEKDVAPSPISKLYNELEESIATGNVGREKVLRQEIINKQKEKPQYGMTVTTQDGTTVTSGPLGDPTVATRTSAQKELLGIEKAISATDNVLTKLRPQDVGVQGLVGNTLDNLFGQFGLKPQDIQRMENRQSVDLLRESSLRLISSDVGAFSNRDRNFVEVIMPTLNPWKSYEHSYTMANGMKQILSKRALMAAKTAESAPPEFAIRALDPEGLLEAVTSGILSADKAKIEWPRAVLRAEKAHAEWLKRFKPTP